MVFNTQSFFAGVGTVLATVIVGFGAGVMMTDAFVGKTQREPNRLERQTTTDDRAAQKPATIVASAPAQPAPLSSAPPAQADIPTAVAAPAAAKAAEPSEVAAQPSPPTVASNNSASSNPAPQAPTQPQAADNARADARDADLRDRRRAERQQARAERRRLWAERRYQQRDDELDAVAEQVRRQPARGGQGEDRPMVVERESRPFVPFRFGND